MDDVRTKLLDAAGPIFAEKGYRATTVREICRAAGANVAAVNYYFGDKQRLYTETVKQASRLRAQQVPLPQRPPGTSAAQRLEDFIVTLLTRMIGAGHQPWQVRLMTREVLQPTQACRELVEDYFRPQFELLLEILGELLPPGTAMHRLRQIGFSIVGQCVYYRVAGEVVAMLTPDEEHAEHFSTAQLAAHISRFTLAAVSGYGRPDGVAPAAEAADRSTASTKTV